MTVAELKKLWEPAAEGKVTRWSQIRAGWPDKEIHLFGAGVDSGTFDYFTEVITGKTDASRGDYTSSEDDNMLVQGVSGDEFALGFFGYAYYETNKDKLRAVPIDDEKADNGAGPIEPTPDTIRTGQLPAAVAARLHLCQREEPVASDRAAVHGLLCEERRGARAGGRLRAADRRGIRARDEAGRGQDAGHDLQDASRGVRREPVHAAAGAVADRDQVPGSRNRLEKARAPLMNRTTRSWLERIIEQLLFACAALSILVTAGIVAVLIFETVGVPARSADHRVPVRHRVDAALLQQEVRRAAAGRGHGARLGHRDGRRAAGRTPQRDLSQ